jgi:hypothetical protein
MAALMGYMLDDLLYQKLDSGAPKIYLNTVLIPVTLCPRISVPSGVGKARPMVRKARLIQSTLAFKCSLVVI